MNGTHLQETGFPVPLKTTLKVQQVKQATTLKVLEPKHLTYYGQSNSMSGVLWMRTTPSQATKLLNTVV